MDRHGSVVEPEPQQPSSEENVMKVDSGSNSEPITLAEANLAEWLIYLMRAIYYIGLLLIIGWVFWWRYIQDYAI